MSNGVWVTFCPTILGEASQVTNSSRSSILSSSLCTGCTVVTITTTGTEFFTTTVVSTMESTITEGPSSGHVVPEVVTFTQTESAEETGTETMTVANGAPAGAGSGAGSGGESNGSGGGAPNVKQSAATLTQVTSTTTINLPNGNSPNSGAPGANIAVSALGPILGEPGGASIAPSSSSAPTPAVDVGNTSPNQDGTEGGSSGQPSAGPDDGTTPREGENNNNQPGGTTNNQPGGTANNQQGGTTNNQQGASSPQNGGQTSNQQGNSNPPQVVNIGGSSITVAPIPPSNTGGGVVINVASNGGGQTLQPGQVATVNGVAVSVPPAGNNLVVGGSSTTAVGSDSNGSPTQVVNIGGSQITIAAAAPGANNNGAVVVAGQTFQPGQVGTINGVAVSVPAGGGNIVVGGATIPVLPTGGLSEGVARVGGTTLGLAPGGTIAVVNGITQTLSGGAPTASPVLTVNGQPVTAVVSGSSTAFVLGPGATLTPGGTAVISGTTFSLPGTGLAVIVNGKTSILGSSNPSVTTPPVLTINGNPITATVSGGTPEFVIAPGTTLTPGGQVIIAGTTYSLPSTATGVVVINGHTSTLATGSITAAPALTINGQTYSASVSNGQTEYVLGPGTTLTLGGVVTISGTRISLDQAGTELVFGSSTSTVGSTPASAAASTTTTTVRGTGNAIASGVSATKHAGAGRVERDAGALMVMVSGLVGVISMSLF